MKGLLKFITCGSVDDGKSTLIGHILYDSKLLYADQEKALELDSKVGSREGKIDYSLLLDGLMAERIAQYVLPPLLAHFIAKFPQVNLSVLNGNSRGVEVALQEHRIELGLVEGIFRLPNLKYTLFLQDELVAVVHVNSKLNIQEEITPAELPDIPLVLRERGSGTLDVFERALSQHNLKLSSLNVLMYLGGTESIKLFLEHTDCMGIVSIRSVHKELVAGTLRVVEIKGMPMLREFNFVQLQGQEGGLSQVFMRFAGHHSKNL